MSRVVCLILAVCLFASPAHALALNVTPAWMYGPRPRRVALQLFQQAEQAPPEEAAARYDAVRVVLEAAIAHQPTHPQVSLVLIYVGQAYERTGRSASAADTYRRITRGQQIHVGADGHPVSGDDLQQRINIFDEAYLRAAENLVRCFDFDSALLEFQQEATNPELARADRHQERSRHAWSAMARIHEWHGRRAEAAAAWQALAQVEAPGAARSEAEHRAVTVAYRAGDWARAAAPMEEHLRRTPDDQHHAASRLLIHHALADVYERRGDARASRAARNAVVRLFRLSEEGPGSASARLAAAAMLRDLDERVMAFRRRRGRVAGAAVPGAGESAWRAEVARVDAIANEVQRLGHSEIGVAALQRQAEAHEHLATLLTIDEAALQERRVALVQYGRAVSVARREDLPVVTVARALDRIHDEENADLATALFAQSDLPFTVHQGMMDLRPPAAIALQPTPIATPGLVRE